MIATRFGAARLASVEFLLIAFTVLLTFASDIFLPLALILLAIAATFHLLKKNRLSLVIPNPIWAVAVLITMSLVSMLVTTQPQITRIQVARLFLGILACAAVMRFIALTSRNVNSQSAKLVLFLTLFGFVLVGLGLALASPFIVDWEGASKFSFLPQKLYSIFILKTKDPVNPNVMAGMLILLTPLATSLFLYRNELLKTIDKRINGLLSGMSLLVAGLSSVVLLLMQSRGAVMGFICSIAVLILLKWRKSRLIVAVLMFLALISLLAILFLRNASQTPSDILVSILGLGQRIDIWSRGILLVQDFSLTGIGMGSFKSVTSLLYPLTLEYHEVPHAHNLFLQVAVDLGIPGLIAWLGILANVVVACITLIRSREPLLRAAGAGLLASNVALCVHGLTDAVTWGMVRTAPLVWALWGLALGASLLCATPAQKTAPPSEATPAPASPATPPPKP